MADIDLKVFLSVQSYPAPSQWRPSSRQGPEETEGAEMATESTELIER